MGIRDLFRKNKKADVVQVSTANAEEAKKKGRERRYSLLVEDVFENSRMQGVMVLGTVHGKVRVGDTLYLYQPKHPVKEVQVSAIELGPREEVEMIKNQRAALCVNLDSVEEVSRFAVLSSVKPLSLELAKRIVENPRLFGLMMEYSNMYTNSAYMDALLYELCEARLVLPLYMGQPPLPQPDGTFAFPKDAQVGFRSLRNPADETQTVFPAFTDEIALLAWKDAFHEGQPRQVAVMQLPHLMEHVDKGHAGLVVNPFGPVSVYFPKELLNAVRESEVFRAKFVKKESEEK